MRRREHMHRSKSAQSPHSFNAISNGSSWPLFFLVLLSLSIIMFSYFSLSKSLSESEHISMPSSVQEVIEAASSFRLIAEKHPQEVFMLYSSVALVKHAFCIPGLGPLVFMGAILYGWWAFPLCVLLSGIGMTMCYYISLHLGHQFLDSCCLPGAVRRFGSSFMRSLSKKVENARRQQKLPLLFLSLRFLPGPQWLFTLLCPHLGIPMKYFLPVSVIASIPLTLLYVRAGTLLLSGDNIFSFYSVLGLLALALAAFLPTLFFRSRPEESTEKS